MSSSGNPLNLQAVVFDLDGLMFNTEDLYDEVLDSMLKRRGHVFTRSLKLDMMGLPGPQAAKVMIDQCRLDDSPSELLEEAHTMMSGLIPERMQKMPGLDICLQKIEEAGLPKSVATSSTRPFAHSALGSAGLMERFQFILTAEDVVHGKPHPQIYLKSAELHSTSPGKMLVLEDSFTGSTAAAASGAITVAIPGHHSSDQDFSHVTYLFDRLDHPELLSLIA